MPGTWFKLLGINPMTGGFSILLKVEPDNRAPVHSHLGAVEGIILKAASLMERITDTPVITYSKEREFVTSRIPTRTVYLCLQ
jgi:hypothetical protein